MFSLCFQQLPSMHAAMTHSAERHQFTQSLVDLKHLMHSSCVFHILLTDKDTPFTICSCQLIQCAE